MFPSTSWSRLRIEAVTMDRSRIAAVPGYWLACLSPTAFHPETDIAKSRWACGPVRGATSTAIIVPGVNSLFGNIDGAIVEDTSVDGRRRTVPAE